MKTLVSYYSHSGNNRYIAEKIASELGADLYSIQPRLSGIVFQVLATLSNCSLGFWKKGLTLDQYDRVILCGPIWMGKLIAPLKDFLKKYDRGIRSLYFVSCFSLSYAQKDTKYGYSASFEQVRSLMGERYAGEAVFSIDYLVPEAKKGDGKELMKTHLSDENFTGEIAQRLTDFIGTLKV
ncbi:hypothetical protein MASR2M78_19170 [Treponema sp.]